jgi:hypothetical protein
MTGVAVVGVLRMIKDLEYGWMVWKVVMILYNYVVQSGDVRKRGIGVGDFLSESNQEIVYLTCSEKCRTVFGLIGTFVYPYYGRG